MADFSAFPEPFASEPRIMVMPISDAGRALAHRMLPGLVGFSFLESEYPAFVEGATADGMTISAGKVTRTGDRARWERDE